MLHGPSPPLERKKMKQLKDKDGHSRSSSYTALCSQRVKVFCAKAEGGRVLGKPSRRLHSKEFFLDMLSKAKGLTIYRPLQKGEALNTALSEGREAPIFVAIITKPCITLHRIALGKCWLGAHSLRAAHSLRSLCVPLTCTWPLCAQESNVRFISSHTEVQMLASQSSNNMSPLQ